MTRPEAKGVAVQAVLKSFATLADAFPAGNEDALDGWRSTLRATGSSPVEPLMFLTRIYKASYEDPDGMLSDANLIRGQLAREFTELAYERGASEYDTTRAFFLGVPRDQRQSVLDAMLEDEREFAEGDLDRLTAEFNLEY